MTEQGPEGRGGRPWLTWIACMVIVLILMLAAHLARARDLGQWQNVDPAVKVWFETLMQPDVPTASCCGEADAYWCDDVHVRDGKTFCAITDDRPDGPLQRPHREIGTEIEIPNHKLKWDRGNPTGHSIVFLSREDFVFCFVQGSGT